MIEIACPACGFSERDFARTLRLGCSHCYETFRPNLSTMLPSLHRGTRHLGKSPPHASRLSGNLRRELVEIESLLRVSSGDPSRMDALLDRWKEVSERLALAGSRVSAP